MYFVNFENFCEKYRSFAIIAKVIFMKKVAEILKNTREDLDLTQIDVMRRTGIHNKTLSGYENGISEPDLETFATLMRLYQLSADEVLGIKGGKSYTNSKETMLLRSFRKLSEKQQADLIVMIEALTR